MGDNRADCVQSSTCSLGSEVVSTVDPADRELVNAAIAMAHSLGMDVVAEGVEQKSALKLLQKLGCDTIQGYLISKPLAQKKFDAYLKNK